MIGCCYHIRNNYFNYELPYMYTVDDTRCVSFSSFIKHSWFGDIT